MSGRLHIAALSVLLVPGCAISFSTAPVPTPDGDDDVEDAFEDLEIEPDAVGDPDAADSEEEPTGCDPGGSDDHCDGNTLMRCNAEGTAFIEVDCSPGICLDDFHAHCMGMDVSNVDDDSLLCAGTSGLGPLEIPTYAAWVMFVTDTGLVMASDEEFVLPTIIRENGEGVIDGIAYTQQEQPGGAPTLGILSVSELHVPEGVGFVAMGPLAGVVLSCGPVLVEGLAGSFALPADTFEETPVPGAAGGLGGIAPAAPDGGGPGGGGMGGMVFSYRGGGGGGAHGGAGGGGGSLGTASGGPGGTAYGATDLVPLTAGSGGGAGADPYDAACSSEGGSGGGAFHIASASSIEVTAGGSIDVGGGGGTGGMACSSGGAGGGGGGAGGGLLLEAPVVTVAGYLLAAGGGGGSGSSSDALGGTDGTQGVAALGTALGGFSSGMGTRGGDGGSPASGVGLDGGDGTLGVEIYMGGGGGGDGIVRINGLEVNVSEALLHPAFDSDLFSTGELLLFTP